MKLILILIFLSLNTYSQTQLNVATFNIRFFGLGGEMSSLPTDEYRDNWITEFTNLTLNDRDVIVFEEIVDVLRLKNILSPLKLNCTSYDHENIKHQHVVICLKDRYEFIKENFDDNFTIEEITTVIDGKLRPAVYGKIKDKVSQKELAHIIGVHLKAAPQFFEARMKQVEIIKKYILKMNDHLPIIFLGDLNTHIKELTDNSTDDVTMMENTLKDVDLKLVTNPFPYTYVMSGEGKAKLDHVFVSKSVDVLKVEVGTACKEIQNTRRFENILFYNRMVSDHCPLMVDLKL